MAFRSRSGEPRPTRLTGGGRVASGPLWELAPTAMVAVDAGHKVVAWNRAAARLFGYSAEEVLGKPYPLVASEHHAAFTRRLPPTTGSGPSEEELAEPVECERLHKGGHRLRVRAALAYAGTRAAPLFIESFVDCRPLTSEPTAELRPGADPPHALRESQQRFQAFMDNIPLAAWEVDADNRIVQANGACAWFTGASLPGVMGQVVGELFPPEYAAVYRARNELVLRTGQTQEWSLSFRRSDGTPFESFIIQFPIPGPTGQTIGAIALNLTEHHLLREQIHQQAQLIANGLQAVITCDPQGRISSWNYGAELAFGYTAEEALDLEITEVLRPDAYAGTIASPQEVLTLLGQSDGKPTEARLRRQSGEPFFAQLLCKPLRDSEGAELGTIAYVQDITQRKRVEEELGVQQARMQGIVNTAVDVILTICDRGLIESANPAMRRLLGYEPEELLGQALTSILAPASAQFYDEFLRRNPRTGERRAIGKSHEVTARSKDGREIPVQISVGEMQLGVRSVFTAIIHDLTDRKNLEQQFLQSQKMEAVGLLAGGVAHDFNNLLTAINGYSDLLLRSVSPGSSTYSMAQEIHLAGKRAATLTRQLLAFSRKQVLAPVVLSLSRVVADMVKLLLRLVGEDVVVQTALADDLWPCRADLGQLEQVVMNLAVNARDAMPGGGQLTLSTSNVTVDEAQGRTELPAGQYACLSVSDSGCGMDAATRARLFEPFFTTKEAGRGTGLGLATVYGIVKQSGGFITVDSTVGHGSLFRIWLPRTHVLPSVVPAGPVRQPSPVGREVILLVEDEVSVRTMTYRLLLLGGYTVLPAANAAEAEQLLASQKGPVHMLLTDIVMPGESGIDLSARLRQQRPELAVLYISGYAEGSLPSRSALPTGASLLQKPFSSDALLGRVREVLDRATRRRGRRSEPGI